ncbi:MAG: alternative ribosome rescue aminoacyl-tRNA hydrolase ArfB [Lysobacterales bacterium]|nr:aminoacyl-tRNA hydrolase [Xanthomonadales bacterium]MCP5475554.1 aminoacyl-tRNA hydrolase [Rhodanobacteraceae bacterium]
MNAPSDTLEVIPGIHLSEDELVERFVRSSGPGGQNVNKVSSAVELRFDVKQSPNLPEWLRLRVLAARDRRLTNEGVLVLQAQRFRTLERNRVDARERLLALLRTHTIEQKKRIATAPTRASERRRIEAKKARASTKQLRGKRGFDE